MHHLNSQTQLASFHRKRTMNSLNNTGDNHTDGEANTPGSVSRSGRVRKKNSFLDVYDSTDIIEKRRRRGEKTQKNAKNVQNTGSRSLSKHHAYKGKRANYYQNNIHSSSDIYQATDLYSPLDLQPFEGEVPEIAGEEVIDESLLDDDDLESDIPNSFQRRQTNKVQLKSQAQSTYMMEKSFLKQRKIPGIPGTKTKATRKDKGSSRVTGYMLWAKSQTPHGRSIMDMRDLWATLPLSQKKMWKTKAAKIMKKKVNGAENLKTSGQPRLSLASTPEPLISQKKSLMKNTTPREVYLPKRPPGRPPKKTIQLQKTFPVTVPGPSKKSAVFSPIKSTVTQHTKLASSSATTPNAVSSQQLLLANARKEPYQFQVTGTNPLDVAAHLSLLGEQMKKLGEKFQNSKDQPTNDSLSLLLDSLLCSIGPLLCLTLKVPEFNMPELEETLKRILNNTDYIMPGL